MSKEAQRMKQKRNSSDKLQFTLSKLREGFNKGVRNFSDEYVNTVESMKPKQYQDQPGERPMATERVPEKTPPMPVNTILPGPYLMGQRNRSIPDNLPVQEPQTLSSFDGYIPKSNAEGKALAKEEKRKEEEKAKMPAMKNQQDETQEGRPGGSGRQVPKKEERQWKVSYRKQAYLNRRLAELDKKKQRDLLNKAGSGTRTRETR